MANDYFEHDTKLKPGTKARAEDVNSRFDGVVTGMEKLPAPHPSLKGFSDPVAVGAPTEKEHAVSVEQALGGGISFGVDTGAVNAYVVDLPVAPVSYTVGLIISFQAVNGNIGTATIDLNGLGVKSLTRADGTILVNGDIANDQICSFVYDGSVFKATSAFAGQFSELEAAVQISADAAAVSATDAGNDAIATGLDAIATAADRVQTGLDVVATAADRVQTGLDVIAIGSAEAATAADRVQTGLDAATTAADRVQTNLDKIATAADLVATNQDTIDTAADKTAAEAAKTAAEAAETNILGAEPAVIAQGDTQVARVLAEGDTQVARLDTIPDPSTGTDGQAIVVNPTLDGFILAEGGGGGGLAWAIEATPVTAEDANGYTMDAQLATQVINLPAGTEGMTIGGQYLTEFSASQDFFINFVPNGTENIEGANQTVVLDSKSAILVYSDATNGWKVNTVTPFCAGNPLIANKPFAHFQGQYATGVDAVADASGYVDTIVNTTVSSDITGTSIVSGKISIPAGSYHIKATRPFRGSTYSGYRLELPNVSPAIVGPNITTNNANDCGITLLEGSFTLTSPTVLDLQAFSGGGTIALSTASDQSPYEVYMDVQLWRLDQEIATPQIASPPNTAIAGVPVTGNIYGLNLSMNAGSPTDTIDIEAGTCMDDTGLEELVHTGGTLVVGSTINTIYNLFVTKTSGIVGVNWDTDVDGANLVVDYKRWIGFVRNNSSGDICLFDMELDELVFGKPLENVFVSSPIPTAFTQYALDTLIPISRCGKGKIGVHDTGSENQLMYTSLDGVTIYGYTTNNTNLAMNYLGGTDFVSGWYLQAKDSASNDGVIGLLSITLKR